MWTWLVAAFTALTRIIAPASYEAGRIAGRQDAEREHQVEQLTRERDDAVEDARRADRLRGIGDGRDDRGVADRLRDGSF